MASNWQVMPFSQAITVNPRVQLKRGAVYPFVDMGAIKSGSRSAFSSEERKFDGGGSRFAVGDTLMARITPCLENGKISRFAGKSGEPEQRAIAHILGTLDDKIELNRRMNETLEAMARALFKSWFVDFDPVRAKAEGRDPGLPKPLADLFPARLVDSELGEIPEGWCSYRGNRNCNNCDSPWEGRY
jgi:hypothetical protein